MPLPKSELDRIAPPEPTEESRQLNLDIANRERAALDLPPQQRLFLERDIADLRIMARCSVRTVAEPILPSSLTLTERGALMDGLDQLVEDFGLMPVCRSVQSPEGLPLLDGAVCKLLTTYGYGEVWRAMRLELSANGIES